MVAMETLVMNTVNVIEVLNGSINSLQAFIDNEDGNALAEKTFHDILIEHGVEEDDIDSYIEDGNYSDDNGFEVNLVHSC
jgi:hypothetical protein